MQEPKEVNSENSKVICTDEGAKNAPFIFTKSLLEEIKLMVGIYAPLSLIIMFNYVPEAVGKCFVGRMPNENTSMTLSAVGLAQNYANMTGMIIGWGFNSALLTLIPQCIGSNRKDLLQVYVQRAFVITMSVSLISCIFYIYSGEILCAFLGYSNDNTICHYIGMYCLHLIPWLFCAVCVIMFTTLFQNLNFNFELLMITVCCAALSPVWCYLFIYPLGMGYLGAAVSQCICQISILIVCIIFLCIKGYGYIFVPLPWQVTMQCAKVKEYLALAIPGLVEVGGGWFIAEIVCVLSGYIAKPDIAISSVVISYSILTIFGGLGDGIRMAVTVRVGKYIGHSSIAYAKRVCMAALIIVVITIIFMTIILISLRYQLPNLFSNNSDVIILASKLMYFVLLIAVLNVFVMAICGVFNGLGKPIIPGIVLFTCQDIIAFPLCIVFLFVMHFRNYTDWGVFTVVGCFTFSFCASAFVMLVVFIIKYKNIWNQAVSESKSRLKSTQQNNYGAVAIVDHVVVN